MSDLISLRLKDGGVFACDVFEEILLSCVCVCVCVCVCD